MPRKEAQHHKNQGRTGHRLCLGLGRQPGSRPRHYNGAGVDVRDNLLQVLEGADGGGAAAASSLTPAVPGAGAVGRRRTPAGGVLHRKDLGKIRRRHDARRRRQPPLRTGGAWTPDGALSASTVILAATTVAAEREPPSTVALS